MVELPHFDIGETLSTIWNIAERHLDRVCFEMVPHLCGSLILHCKVKFTNIVIVWNLLQNTMLALKKDRKIYCHCHIVDLSTEYHVSSDEHRVRVLHLVWV